MLKKDLMLRNPLRILEQEEKGFLGKTEFGAVLARAGVGKTAFLVQLALNSLLNSKNVLHISLETPVDKVDLWYEEVFRNIADQYQINPATQPFEYILPHRFIMTFKVEGFSVPKLEERLTDLTEQGIFMPQLVLIDDLPFGEQTDALLAELKDLARKLELPIWFTVLTHRHETPADDGLPIQIANVAELFEVIIQLQPVENKIDIKLVKGRNPDAANASIQLDPATMLIVDSSK